MPNLLDTLFTAHIETFAMGFKNTAHDLFYDEERGELIHPGEYGNLRESLCRTFLASFLPEAYGVSQGFVISPNGVVSNQCDVIVYSKEHTPIIRTPEHQRFFPIETVVAVGEVKSSVDGSILRDALRKLQRVKEMRASLTSVAIARQDPLRGVYAPLSFVRDQIATFIIAEKLAMSRSLVKEIVEQSTTASHPSFRINHIASIDDYCTDYHDPDGKAWMYPIWIDGQELPIAFDDPIADKHPHLKLFFRYLLLIIDSATILSAELTHYFEGMRGVKHSTE